MTRFTVHLDREVRLRFENVEAASHEEAAAIARQLPAEEAAEVDDCEGEDFGAVIEAQGPEAVEHPVRARFEAGRARDSTPLLLEALATVAGDAAACTCHTRSWDGNGHDAHCPIRVAGDALARATS
jgi:hypothetical protein